MGPDQTPRAAASDLGLHRLPMSHLWDASTCGLICVVEYGPSNLFHSFGATQTLILYEPKWEGPKKLI